MKFLFLCVISLMSFDRALSQCNTCLATGKVACFSTTQYFSCSNSVIDISTLKTCPTNQFCGDVETGCSADAATRIGADLRCFLSWHLGALAQPFGG